MPLTREGKIVSGVIAAGCAAAAVLGFTVIGQHPGASAGTPTTATSTTAGNPASIAGQHPSVNSSSNAAAADAVASTSATPSSPSTSSKSSSSSPVVDPKQVQKAEALTTAQQFSVAYARPPGGPNLYAWWDTVSPFLTPQAVKGSLHRKPQKSPYTKVTGVAKAVGTTPNIRNKGPRDYLIDVPTDKGTWRVRVTTQQSDRPLVVSAAMQPAKKKPTKKPSPAKHKTSKSSSNAKHK